MGGCAEDGQLKWANWARCLHHRIISEVQQQVPFGFAQGRLSSGCVEGHLRSSAAPPGLGIFVFAFPGLRYACPGIFSTAPSGSERVSKHLASARTRFSSTLVSSRSNDAQDDSFLVGADFGLTKLIRIRLAGLHDANHVIGEHGVAAGQFNLGHVATYTAFLAHWTAFYWR
jgi:hypothetical protein